MILNNLNLVKKKKLTGGNGLVIMGKDSHSQFQRLSQRLPKLSIHTPISNFRLLFPPKTDRLRQGNKGIRN